VNARKRALGKYGSYGAGALIFATLAALGSLGVFPLVTGPGRPVFLGGVAVVMLLQGVAHSRTKRQDCFIVRREELIGGTFILFVGAVLLLVLMLAGCSRPATAKLRRPQIINFYGGESTELGPYSALMGHFSLQRKTLRRERKNQTRPLAGGCDPAGLRSWDRKRCVAQKPRQRVSLGGTNRCRERATPNEGS
jgi:hypothetical protein